MHLSSIITLLIAAAPLAAPHQRNGRRKGNANALPPDGTITQDAEKFAGGRTVLPGAQCIIVQGRRVCNDGVGNTFFADEPFNS